MESSIEHQNKEKIIWIGSNQIKFIATGNETKGTYALIEMTVEPKSQVPLHMHSREDEGLYVIDGELSVMHDQSTKNISSGSHVFLPRGIPHSYKNLGQKQCRILLFYTPSGFENFLEEISNENLSNTKEEGIGDKMKRVANRYGVSIITGAE